MAYKQMGLVDLISAIQNKVEERTGIRCYDAVPIIRSVLSIMPRWSASVPRIQKRCGGIFLRYGSMQSLSQESLRYRYMILIQRLEEALTEDIDLPEEYELIMQTNNGIQTIKTDETKEKHAVLAYEFMVCYGYKCKI